MTNAECRIRENDEIRMTNAERMTKSEKSFRYLKIPARFVIRHRASSFCGDSLLVDESDQGPCSRVRLGQNG
jgi:hypothetical protein